MSSKTLPFPDVHVTCPSIPPTIICTANSDSAILPYFKDGLLYFCLSDSITIEPGVSTHHFGFGLRISKGYYMTIETAYALSIDDISVVDMSFSGKCQNFSVTFLNRSGNNVTYYCLTQIAKGRLCRTIPFRFQPKLTAQAPGIRADITKFALPPHNPLHSNHPSLGAECPPGYINQPVNIERSKSVRAKNGEMDNAIITSLKALQVKDKSELVSRTDVNDPFTAYILECHPEDSEEDENNLDNSENGLAQ